MMAARSSTDGSFVQILFVLGVTSTLVHVHVSKRTAFAPKAVATLTAANDEGTWSHSPSKHGCLCKATPDLGMPLPPLQGVPHLGTLETPPLLPAVLAQQRCSLNKERAEEVLRGRVARIRLQHLPPRQPRKVVHPLALPQLRHAVHNNAHHEEQAAAVLF